MKVFTTISDLQQFLKISQHPIGFIPTMGSLHKGHLSLVEKARNKNKTIIVSIFVNKLQFNDLKDFEKYPRTLEEDIEKLSNTGCDVVFAPKDQEIPVLNNHYDLQGLD
ncbi:MAG TPA: pantoate--beta-alanine ligase, partial [Candidatus Dojkabacteria bacterium]